ncbi:sensor histidine kinase [Vagococcus sp. BWB3-3]|uniref:histidine kinase n=1 Tax=Vagococcus allomyrinae TaxID=2794353 RepID=A0A940SVS5_9ENTE|nr:sensor histidine kinase [Vagococcus allomyrinae]MBP1041366.1 sensor histidine kinase [Vagococcus allomyrinae]
MKLFLRQQVPFIVMYVLLTVLLIGMVWLDGYRKTVLLMYGVLLSAFILLFFLGFVYMTQRNLYQTLSRDRKKDVYEEIDNDASPLSQSINELLQGQYQRYFNDLKQLKNARDEHTRFINQWVHQMKTPLAVIELMMQDEELDKDSLIEETDRMKEGLNLALTMARIESFQQDFVIERVNLKSLANRAVADHKRNFIRNYVYPKIVIDEDITVETDEKWLSFILYQLISNAIKYSAMSEKTIEISAAQEFGKTQLKITDHGIGIAKSDLPRVFQAFFTGDQGREHHEATGMGLYLVQQIAQELTHSVEIESEVGAGTTVSVIF